MLKLQLKIELQVYKVSSSNQIIPKEKEYQPLPIHKTPLTCPKKKKIKGRGRSKMLPSKVDRSHCSKAYGEALKGGWQGSWPQG
jgi:hypothetical protein